MRKRATVPMALIVHGSDGIGSSLSLSSARFAATPCSRRIARYRAAIATTVSLNCSVRTVKFASAKTGAGLPPVFPQRISCCVRKTSDMISICVVGSGEWLRMYRRCCTQSASLTPPLRLPFGDAA